VDDRERKLGRARSGASGRAGEYHRARSERRVSAGAERFRLGVHAAESGFAFDPTWLPGILEAFAKWS
jgi:hypothetical protein